MRQLLSPKQVAASAGVSESSLKRWCDQGLIPIERTPGGHRRIRLRDAVQFFRDRGDDLIKPELLGLPPKIEASPTNLAETIAPLTAALDSGDTEAARQLVLACYLQRNRIAEICDQLLTPVMHKLGHEWRCGRLEVFQERRACEVVNQLLFELQSIAPRPREGAPIAIGGSPEGDQYRLATQMVAMALIEEGWLATSLGSNLPFETIKTAVHRHQPRLLWLSVSSTEDPSATAEGVRQLANDLGEGIDFIVGGQAISAEMLSGLDGIRACSSLVELQQIARTL